MSDVAASATRLVIISKGCLLQDASPEELLHSVEGRVWGWEVGSQELPELRETHLISGTIRKPEGVQLRIVSDRQPGSGACQLPPTLEDAYLAAITANREERP